MTSLWLNNDDIWIMIIHWIVIGNSSSTISCVALTLECIIKWLSRNYMYIVDDCCFNKSQQSLCQKTNKKIERKWADNVMFNSYANKGHKSNVYKNIIKRF